MLQIKSENDCRWDLIALGEVLLRFDAGDERIQTAQTFRVFDGGGEYNVARNLSKTFRRRTAIATALTDNALGRLAENLIRQGGVDASQILWREADAAARNGIYFIERGFGLRVPASCFDRANTVISQVKPEDFDWRKIFAEDKTRWLHTGGIFAGLSDTTARTAAEAMRTAKENATIVSYDLNYRDSLWKTRGGRAAANNLNRKLLPFADVVFGAFDFDSRLSKFNREDFQSAARKMKTAFPNLKIIVSTLREVHTASRHDLSAACFAEDHTFKAQDFLNIEVFDRVGSGDAFAAGFIYGLLSDKSAQFAVECGTAHGALLMTTPGDNSMSTLAEVERLMNDRSAQAIR